MEDELTLGRTLRQAREARKLTLSAVANTTKVSQPVLESIETDAFSALPADVYVRGFVRAYCRAVDLPEKAPMEMLERALVQRKNTAPTGLGATPEEIGRPLMPVEPFGGLGRTKLTILLVAGGLVVLVLIYLFVR